MIVKAGAGLVAGVLAGGLGFAFWPRVEPGVVSPRPAVEKPVFVLEAQPASRPSVDTVFATPPGGVEKTGLVKLAAALRGDAGPTPAPAPLSRGLSDASLKFGTPNEEAAKFCALGLVALADGDVAAARAFLERAADGGDTRALLVLGDTYDPATLARLGVVGIRGDASRARDYYARALSAGVGVARKRIASLDSQGD